MFSQNLVSGDDPERVNLGHVLEEEDKEFKMIPLIIIFSCLTTVLVFVMIIVTLVKRSSEYSKGSGRPVSDVLWLFSSSLTVTESCYI